MSTTSCGGPSVGDGDVLMARRLRFGQGRVCIKCKVSPGNVAIRDAVYCKACFIHLVTIKFRRSLEPNVNAHAGTSKRPKLKASGSLILAFSGGLGSSVLLDIVHRTYFANGHARGGTKHPRSADVWTSCTVCYVEVCSAFPETRDRTKDIMTALESYPKFDFIPLRLEHAFDDSWWRSVTTETPDRPQLAIELGRDGLYTEALHYTPSCDITPVDALRAYLGSLPTQTAISSAIRILVRLLLLYTARSRQASHLLLGTSLTTLSISLISCISQGGGHSIPGEIQEEWHAPTKEETIRIIRPLRDVSMKECSMFAWWSAIHVVGRDKQTRAVAGILGLTKDFIVGLEKDYPSTVSTIIRTCAKLEPKCASVCLCILCQRPVQAGLDDWRNQVAIRSYSDTKLGPNVAPLPSPAQTGASDVSHNTILTSLCYSCRTMLTSKGTRSSKSAPSVHGGSSAPLPLWVSASQLREDGELWVSGPLDESDQRSKVADFLLDQAV